MIGQCDYCCHVVIASTTHPPPHRLTIAPLNPTPCLPLPQVTATLVPPALIILLYFYNLCRSCFDFTLTAKRSTGVALLILYAMLPVTSATIFSTFGCEDFDDGTSLLRSGTRGLAERTHARTHESAHAPTPTPHSHTRVYTHSPTHPPLTRTPLPAADFSVSCQDPRYAWFKMFALIMVFVWPVGVPVTFAAILISRRKELRNDATDKDGELVRNNDRSIGNPI